MYKPAFLIFFLALLFTNCKTVSVNQEIQKITTKQVVLANIGLQKDNVLQTGFNITAIPKYNQSIKVLATSVQFNNQTFKAFSEAQKTQESDFKINYIDSLPNKPKFITLQIVDRVGLLSELNSKENEDVKAYLTNKENANIITGVSIALSKQMLNEINRADNIFLIENGLKSYGLQLYKNDEPIKNIQFNEGVIFAYRTSNCCWQENKKHQINIVDLVDGQGSCPNKTYKSAIQAKKKVNYFKF